MFASPQGVVGLYLAALASMIGAVQLRLDIDAGPWRPLERARARGEVIAGVPRLDPDDAMANAAVLMAALHEAGDCGAAPRAFAVFIEGGLSRVHFAATAVCQLRRLKQISAAQPGFGQHGLGEVAAFVLGRRNGLSVEVTRVVVPPFRFTGETVSFVDADLGPLAPSEKFVGTYHTHPDGDLEQGVLSTRDLRYLFRGRVDFHGQVGRLRAPGPDVDWLFDIVEPRDGDWNVYAHDRERLAALVQQCAGAANCPVDALRVTGSPYYLFTRYYEERSGPPTYTE